MGVTGRPEEKASLSGFHTTLRRDADLFSIAGKKIILVAFSVPWEEGCEEALESRAER